MLTIAHRLSLALLSLLAFAAPAGAAEVARSDGSALSASDGRGSDFCIELRLESPTDTRGASTCGRAPRRPLRSMLAIAGTDEAAAAGGAVPAEIVRGEAELTDGRRVAFATVPGERYQGREAGRLRFFLVSLPVVAPRDEDTQGIVVIRFFDAAGALRGVAWSEPLGTIASPKVTLLRQHVRGRTLTVSAQTRRVVASTPLALDRLEEATCLVLRSRDGLTTGCRDSSPYQPVLDLQPEHGCGRVRSMLYGFAADDVSTVRLKLGSGRTKVVRTRTLRDPLGREYRVLATLLPRGEAVRHARADGHAGRFDLGLRPGGLPCVRNGGTGTFGVYAPLRGEGPALPGAQAQVVAERDGHRLLAGDGAEERLCFGLDRVIADGADCRLPPVVSDYLYANAAHGLAWAVLPAEVARVRLPNGRVVTPVTGGYTGRYAGKIGFLLVRVAGGERMTMLDASGAVIGRLPVNGGNPASSARPRRVARGRGWRLTAIGAGEYSCLALVLRGDEPGCEAFAFGEDGAYAAVGCAPRVSVLFGPLGRRTRSVRATLAGGRTLRARILRIPRRLGGGRAWVLALERGARVKALRFDGRRTPFAVPPATRQCGYRIAEPFVGGDEDSVRTLSARAWRGTARPRGSWSSP